MKIFKGMSVLVVVMVFGLVLGLYANSDLDPKVWQPSSNPGLTGVYAKNTVLSDVELIQPVSGHGPESVAVDSQGRFYTGYEDGRIVRFSSEQGLAGEGEVFANTGGRPLGLAFDANGKLIVADALRGLLSISLSGNVSLLTDSVNGEKLVFVDDLDIAENGTIWFSDASARWDYHHVAQDIVEASATGRLLSYDPATGNTALALDGLFFANGVTLGPNDEFVLVSETGASQIKRLWLKGPNAGESDIFISGLPAMPDNINFNGTDTVWVALQSLRVQLLEDLASATFTRKLIGGLPASATGQPFAYGFLVGVNLAGEVKYNFQGSKEHVSFITSVLEVDDKLYLGSNETGSLGVFSLDR